MLKKRNRLKKNSSFRATFFQNRVVSDEFFILYAGKDKTTPTLDTKIGFVVTKKIDKRAVVRNKIKRRMREAFFEYLKTCEIPYISLVLKAKSASIDVSYLQVLKSVNNLMLRMAKNKFSGFSSKVRPQGRM